MPDLRHLYPIPYVRAILHLVLVSSFLLGVLSICLRQNKVLGLCGIILTLLATLLGGSRVPLDGELRDGPFLGLDWALLNLMLFTAVMIPLERLFARLPDQPVFRPGWRTDVAYFFISALLVQLTTILTMKPAMVLFSFAVYPDVQNWIRGLPFLVQFLLILIISDLVQYWIHRLFHTVPWLWRFHEIHHSTENMDWLAGERSHMVDLAVTRASMYIPVFILGFADAALYAYILWVTIQATFIHANVRWEFGPLKWLLVTPQFHHWHHAAEEAAVDKNFAVHSPIWDMVFGTYYLPERWPHAYGLAHSPPPPSGYFRQLIYAFLPRRKKPAASLEHQAGGD
jgi:lathosterol oxidase